jgi:trehalose 6-phosphate synthase
MAGVVAPVAPARWSVTGDPSDLILVAHRGPVQFTGVGTGDEVQRYAGGLVTALRDLVRHVPGTQWICAAATDADRARAARWLTVPVDRATCRVQMLDIDRDAHHDFYAVVANPILWFVQHGLGDDVEIGPRERRAWHEGYRRVNDTFAATVCEEASPGSVVMVHDYHFYLLPATVRETRPDLFLHFFVHIPWPEPAAWRVLPTDWHRAIFRGLLGSDIVAFHTRRYARRFLAGCRELLGLPVDERRSTVRVDGREVVVRHYPLGIDAAAMSRLAASRQSRAAWRDLVASRPEHLVLRVDRTDPSKNVVRGFCAYERLLERRPDLLGAVTFLALLQPSRQDVPAYARYLDAIRRTVARVNARFATATWTPIDLRLVDDLALAVAAYRCFDVLFVNSVHDGMNLVAKEGLLVNERDGVLALSANAGAHDELGAVAVTLDPLDVDQQAEALGRALGMSALERRRRHDVGVAIVESNDVGKWLARQLRDIARSGPRVATFA